MTERRPPKRSRARREEEEARVREVFQALGGSPELLKGREPSSDRIEDLPKRIEAQTSRTRERDAWTDDEQVTSGIGSTRDGLARPRAGAAYTPLTSPSAPALRRDESIVGRWKAITARSRLRSREDAHSWPSSVTWFWIASLWGALSVMAVALGAGTSYRAPVVLGFVLVCPGLAVVRLVAVPTGGFQLSLSVAISMALAVLVPAALLYAGAWSPLAALLILAVLTSAAATTELAFGPVQSLRDSS